MTHWIVGQDGEKELFEIARRHYSAYKNKNPKIRQFIGPGEHIVLTLPNRRALFAWRKFINDAGEKGINCSIFRNESDILSSDLIREADTIADFCWPGERHYTYVRAEAIKSRNPGWCFICAGWKHCGRTKAGLFILER
jgi:hypothetical protein